jgi:outer membrane protein assembly factor BamB
MSHLRSLALLLVVTPLAVADDRGWTQFRGPDGSGISEAKGLPREWSEKKNVAWKVKVHDKGWSSPVVLGKQVWLTTASEGGKAQYALCFDRESGKLLHDLKVFDTPKLPYYIKPEFNSNASPTPVIEPGRVYVHFGSAGTACLDTETGKTIWSRRDLPCDHFRGPGSSPILWENLILLTFDGFDQQYSVALDKKTGETVWKTPRGLAGSIDNGDLKKAYCTPRVLSMDGKAQMVVSAANGTVSLDPRTGKELWRVVHGGMNAATPPQFGHGLVYVTNGHLKSLLAIKPDGMGDVTKSHVKWESRKEAPSRPAPIVADGLVYLVNDSGQASAMEAKTGKEVWRRRLGGDFYSSPVLADGHLYVIDRKGKCSILAAGREGKLVSTCQLDGEVNATPAIAGKALFIRTATHLYRIEEN